MLNQNCPRPEHTKSCNLLCPGVWATDPLNRKQPDITLRDIFIWYEIWGFLENCGRHFKIPHINFYVIGLNRANLRWICQISGGEISGTVEDSKPRRSPIPSGGLEVKLSLTFKSRGDLIDKLKLLLREAYTWDYTGEQTQGERDDDEDDLNEENDF